MVRGFFARGFFLMQPMRGWRMVMTAASMLFFIELGKNSSQAQR